MKINASKNDRYFFLTGQFFSSRIGPTVSLCDPPLANFEALKTISLINSKNSNFFFQTKAHLDILAEALLRWARGR